MKVVTTISDIPFDCVELIINKIDDKEIASVSLVCRQFHVLSNKRVHKLKFNFVPQLYALSRLLQRFPNLKELFLFDIPGGDDSLTKSLDLIAESGLNLEFIALPRREDFSDFPSEQLIKLRESMPNLKSLYCSYLVQDDEDLITLAEIFSGRLDELDMSLCSTYVTDKGVEMATKMLPNLRRIDISFNLQLNDAWLKPLCVNCPMLEEVVCCGDRKSYVTDAGISTLLECCSKLTRARFDIIRWFKMPEESLGSALRSAEKLTFIQINWVAMEKTMDYHACSGEDEDEEFGPARTVDEFILGLECDMHVHD